MRAEEQFGEEERCGGFVANQKDKSSGVCRQLGEISIEQFQHLPANLPHPNPPLSKGREQEIYKSFAIAISTINYQLSTINYQLSTIYRLMCCASNCLALGL
ncbi:MAG: hypothetical protein HC849_27985 [Oscillatoriales cyanobacterium RU_3_3]|nr:hypothetical protein [Oscillatoriales cyanobacterium RU_3_3]NJR22892.1 hypothetical protein [Richelia sp. CSU_2_1]